jgi:exosortase H (IPTLxxWG-CTERM-specific)
MSKFLIIFLVALSVLFTVELLIPVQQHVIQPFTTGLATVSAAIITPFDDNVISSGRVLRDALGGFAVSIESGCNGVEATIVLIAGVLAFPASLRQKLTAILLGFVAIQALNIVRIISLFYLGQWNYTIFEWFHLYLWPILIMVDVLIVFALYLRWLSGPNNESQPNVDSHA